MRNIKDLTEEEYLHFSKIVRRVETILLETLKKDKSIVLKSGGHVPYFHFHIYPVSHNTPWSEILNVFDMKIQWKAKPGEREELVNMLKKRLKKILDKQE